MYPTAPTEALLNEVAQTSLSLDPVLFFYGVCFSLAVILWTIGVLTLGRAPKEQSIAPAEVTTIEPRHSAPSVRAHVNAA